MYRRSLLLGIGAGIAACRSAAPTGEITVAAAANLTGILDTVAAGFTRETAIRVAFSYGATALLAHQIASGAPFDLFAAADTQHPADLERRQIVERPAVYARGRLALWAPRHPAVRTLADLQRSEVRFIAVARPAAAPYGAAAVEALRRTGVWEAVQPKIVYAGNINMAREYARAGSADVALTAWSLVLHETGAVLVDGALHARLDQAVAVVARSPRAPAARRFLNYVLSAPAQAIFSTRGYEPVRR